MAERGEGAGAGGAVEHVGHTQIVGVVDQIAGAVATEVAYIYGLVAGRGWRVVGLGDGICVIHTAGLVEVGINFLAGGLRHGLKSEGEACGGN